MKVPRRRPAGETSAELASLAARIVQMTDAEIAGLACTDPGKIRSIAASAVRQARPRSPPG